MAEIVQVIPARSPPLGTTASALPYSLNRAWPHGQGPVTGEPSHGWGLAVRPRSLLPPRAIAKATAGRGQEVTCARTGWALGQVFPPSEARFLSFAMAIVIAGCLSCQGDTWTNPRKRDRGPQALLREGAPGQPLGDTAPPPLLRPHLLSASVCRLSSEAAGVAWSLDPGLKSSTS